MMRVSVIIPFFNRSHTIERCLITVQKQTLRDYECLIIDDGSDPNEALGLQRITNNLNDERFRIITMKTNRGGGAARNAGIEQAQGEFVAFLDSDDEWLPLKLEKQLEFSLKQDQPFISCQSFVHYAGGMGVLPTRSLSAELISDYLFCKNGWLPTPSFFLRRDALGMTRFDEWLPRHQDYDFLLELENMGVTASLLMEPLVIVHWEDMHASGRAFNIENSKRFLSMHRQHFSDASASCFWAQFVIIPSTIVIGRFHGLHELLRMNLRFLIYNRNLTINTISHLIFRDDRILRWIKKFGAQKHSPLNGITEKTGK